MGAKELSNARSSSGNPHAEKGRRKEILSQKPCGSCGSEQSGYQVPGPSAMDDTPMSCWGSGGFGELQRWEQVGRCPCSRRQGCVRLPACGSTSMVHKWVKRAGPGIALSRWSLNILRNKKHSPKHLLRPRLVQLLAVMGDGLG